MTPTISIKAGRIKVAWVGYRMYGEPASVVVEWIYQDVLPGADRAQEYVLKYATATQYKTGVEVSIPGGEGKPLAIRMHTGAPNQEKLTRQIDLVRRGLASGREHLEVLTPKC